MTEKNLRPGDRVRNYGEQWNEARRYGTAAVLDIYEVSGGHIEVRVVKDNGSTTDWSYENTIPAVFPKNEAHW